MLLWNQSARIHVSQNKHFKVSTLDRDWWSSANSSKCSTVVLHRCKSGTFALIWGHFHAKQLNQQNETYGAWIQISPLPCVLICTNYIGEKRKQKLKVSKSLDKFSTLLVGGHRSGRLMDEVLLRSNRMCSIIDRVPTSGFRLRSMAVCPLTTMVLKLMKVNFQFCPVARQNRLKLVCFWGGGSTNLGQSVASSAGLSFSSLSQIEVWFQMSTYNFYKWFNLTLDRF